MTLIGNWAHINVKGDFILFTFQGWMQYLNYMNEPEEEVRVVKELLSIHFLQK